MANEQLSQSNQLALEIVGFLENLSRQGSGLPNVFSGVKRDGQQFVCLLSPLNLDRGDRLDFMIDVLCIEECVVFAHTMHVINEAGIETIAVFSGQENEYWSFEFEPSLTGLKMLASNKTTEPAIFFQELFKPHGSGSSKKSKLLELWKQVRSQIMWRTRQE